MNSIEFALIDLSAAVSCHVREDKADGEEVSLAENEVRVASNL
ncbi:hypothetical protein PY650_20170 [Rhizobium calliandrae]|uniref:Uncharacterized protein n=1 Tax=Rhizobium calliandrae TaxID=1312182 RepID=A0ABT7KH49_9HYPH|nr:hypothetical protein [Rhizobium calliandrae]MDL2407935.1 hypothetical protein [Rhizobium calliandrae]